MATRADLAIYQGDDWSGEVTVENDDGTEADLTGYQARAHIRYSYADQSPGAPLVDITAMVQTPIVMLFLDKAATVQLQPPLFSKLVWDLELTAPDQTRTTVLYGDVAVTREVTR